VTIFKYLTNQSDLENNRTHQKFYSTKAVFEADLAKMQSRCNITRRHWILL